MAESPVCPPQSPILAATARPRTAIALPAGILLLLTVAIGFQPMPFDPDVWFHLAGGDTMIAGQSVPQVDPFSFTKSGELWVPHSWLFDVAVATGWRVLGPRGTESVAAGIFALCWLLSFALLLRRGVAPLTAAAVCLALAIAAGNTRGLRPQLGSLLLCNLLIYLLVQHRHAPTGRIRWLLPLVFLFWAQVHAACVLGLIVLAIWLAGRVVDLAAGRLLKTRRCEWSGLLIALGLSTVAVLITPHRITHFEYVALTAGLDALRHTAEWQPPKPLSLAVPDVYAFALLAGVVTVLARRARRVGWAELAIGLALLLVALTGVRHIPLACVASVPLLAAALGDAGWSQPRLAATLARQRVPLLVGGLAVLAVLWRYPTNVAQRFAAVEPVAGARALAVLGQRRNVFTTYNTGSYVLWSGPGVLRVFIDSRADVYGDEIAADARNIQRGKGWAESFARWGVTAAVIERGDPLVQILRADGEWQVLAEDVAAITFVRRNSLPTLCASGRQRPFPT